MMKLTFEQILQKKKRLDAKKQEGLIPLFEAIEILEEPGSVSFNADSPKIDVEADPALTEVARVKEDPPTTPGLVRTPVYLSPQLIFLLVDESASMAGPWSVAGETSKIEKVAQLLNAHIQLFIASSKAIGTPIFIAAFGYQEPENKGAVLHCAAGGWSNAFSHSSFAAPWIKLREPKGKRRVCEAFSELAFSMEELFKCQGVDSRFDLSIPPLIIHLTDAESFSNPKTLRTAREQLKTLSNEQLRHSVVLDIQISDFPGGEVVFPSSEDEIEDVALREQYWSPEPLPLGIQRIAKKVFPNFSLHENRRGVIVNATPATVCRVLELAMSRSRSGKASKWYSMFNSLFDSNKSGALNVQIWMDHLNQKEIR